MQNSSIYVEAESRILKKRKIIIRNMNYNNHNHNHNHNHSINYNINNCRNKSLDLISNDFSNQNHFRNIKAHSHKNSFNFQNKLI